MVVEVLDEKEKREKRKRKEKASEASTSQKIRSEKEIERRGRHYRCATARRHVSDPFEERSYLWFEAN